MTNDVGIAVFYSKPCLCSTPAFVPAMKTCITTDTSTCPKADSDSNVQLALAVQKQVCGSAYFR